MGVTTRGDPANNISVVPYRLVTNDVCWTLRVYVNLEHDELALRSTIVHFGFNCSTTNELVIKLHRTLHACFKRRVDRAVLAKPRAEVLLETHGDECAESEQTHVVFLACFHDEVE